MNEYDMIGTWDIFHLFLHATRLYGYIMVYHGHFLGFDDFDGSGSSFNTRLKGDPNFDKNTQDHHIIISDHI